jgi:cytochrome c-type biogenesis protein CcmE
LRRRLRWALPVLAVAACAAYLVYTATGTSAEYYQTVSEVKAHPTTGDVRVLGVVQDGIQLSNGGLDVRFTAAEGGQSLPVAYHGTLPDIFRPGISVVVEGRMGADGIFHARTLLAKCPSRFSSTQPETGT